MNNSRVYSWLRFFTICLGVFMLVSVVSSLLYPNIIYSEQEKIPTFAEIILNSFPRLLMGIFILIPNRYFLSNKKYSFRLLILSIIGLFFLYKGIVAVYWYLTIDKHWMIVPTGIALILIGLILPMTIYLKNKNKSVLL